MPRTNEAKSILFSGKSMIASMKHLIDVPVVYQQKWKGQYNLNH